MPGRGPARQLPAIAEMKGTDRKRKYRDGDTKAIEVPGKFPGCPTKLDAAGKAEWKRIAAILGTVDGMVVGTDRAVLTGYCHAWSQFWRLDEIVRREGEGDILEDKSGKHYKNPAAVMMGDARTAMLRFAQELGFSPASRSRVRVPEKKASGGTGYEGHAG